VENGRSGWHPLVKEIRIYIEGGGDSKDTKAFLRQGFSIFLQSLVSMARQNGIRWRIVTCGSRQAAFEALRTAQRDNTESFNVLLVDSEGPVQTTPWLHLRLRDAWDHDNLSDDHCHLMTQAMEAWFIADVEALSNFYGAGFHRNSLPRNPNVEQIAKTQLEPSLKAATRATQKGEYHKIRHASKLLEVISVEVVRGASRHCDRLFTTLTRKMQKD
jgi:hypothetical protein